MTKIKTNFFYFDCILSVLNRRIIKWPVIDLVCLVVVSSNLTLYLVKDNPERCAPLEKHFHVLGSWCGIR